MALDAILPVVLNVALVAVLTFLSQTFTGLNIGLLSLDTAQLQVLIDVPNKDEAAMKSAKYARRILPLRRRGNLLLCTILLGNTVVNAVMAVVLSGIAGGFLGWLITTVIIVIFCEIVPQSVCTRHGLFLGAKGAPIINVAMVLFYPITKPYAVVLDRLFPQRENLLDRSQLRSLVEYQSSSQPTMLARGQAEMLIGALGYAERTVEEVMVPLEKAFHLQLDSVLDYDLVASVVQKGFSRLPVLDPKTGQVEGLLHCKDLLKQRFLHLPVEQSVGEEPPGEAQTPKQAAPLTAGDFLRALRLLGQERQVYACGKHTKLMELLGDFKHRPHLAVVADADEQGAATGTSRHVGIVTLHNIFETILQAPVGDFEEHTSVNPTRRLRRQAGTVRLFDPRRLVAMAEQCEALGEEEAEAVATLLVSTGVPAFSPDRISGEELHGMLRELRPIWLARRTALYRRQEKATHGTVVLHGAVGLATGEESFESTLGPLSCLGMRALAPHDTPQPYAADGSPVALKCELEQLEAASVYVPDFTATVLTDGCLVLELDRRRYLEAHLRTKRTCSS